MSIPTPSVPLVVATVALLVGATVTDLRARRIPNWLTFPAMATGLGIRSFEEGWTGLLAAVLGGLTAPAVLMAVRAFRPVGMGDLKLSIAVGFLLGPAGGAVAMLVSAVAGGLLALVFALKPGTAAARSFSPFLIGVPFLGRRYDAATAEGSGTPTASVTLPYGVAISIGTLLMLGVMQWS